MTTKKILFEDFYKTTITETISDSGDVDFEVASAPQNKMGWIIVNPESSGLRERMFYHDVIGNRVYVRGVNRHSPKEHLSGSTVQINDSALIFNYLSEMVETTFYVEKLGGLSVNIWGGPVLIGKTMSEVDDTELLLTNNVINYIYYDLDDGEIKVSSSEATVIANNGIIKAEVTTSSGQISTINYRKYSIIEGVQGPQGDEGKSAYEIAVDEGFIGTEEQWLDSLKGEPGPQGAITNDGETQEVEDLLVIPSGATVTYDDDEKWIKIELSTGFYTLYTATGNTHPFTLASGIFQYSDINELLSSELIDGTYDTGTHSITYENGAVVNGVTGAIQLSNANIAYRNTENTFKKTNNFEGPSIFKSHVSFPYHRIDVNGIDDILFDGLNGTKQRTININTALDSSLTLSFENLFIGSNYELIINNNSGGDITLSKGTITNSDTVTNFYSIGGTTYPLTLSTGVHFFVMDTADTGIHISYVGKSEII